MVSKISLRPICDADHDQWPACQMCTGLHKASTFVTNVPDKATRQVPDNAEGSRVLQESLLRQSTANSLHSRVGPP